MIDPQKNIRRLHARSDAHRGLVVDETGVAFGTACELVRRLPGGGYRTLDERELALVAGGAGMGEAGRILKRRLSRIADALEDGDLVHAQLLGLQLPLATQAPPAGSGFSKAGYDENEPRNAAGKWGIGGMATAAAEGMGFAEGGASAIAAAARAALASVAGVASGAAGLLAGLVYPSGNWDTFQGKLPDRQDVDFRYDEGELSLYRTAPDGGRTQLYQGRAGEDQLYRDASGSVVGVDLGRGFHIDIDRIEAPASGTDRAAARATAQATTDEPQVCPDPSLDHPHSASARAIAYQWQITHLTPMFAVALNGQVYDGCDLITGAMLEAKGPGFERLMRYPFIWDRIQRTFDNLALRQSNAAGGRRVEWHFAEEAVADRVRAHFSEIGLENVDVIYTPAIVVITPVRE